MKIAMRYLFVAAACVLALCMWAIYQAEGPGAFTHRLSPRPDLRIIYETPEPHWGWE